MHEEDVARRQLRLGEAGDRGLEGILQRQMPVRQVGGGEGSAPDRVSSSLAARSLGVSATLPPAATVIARSPDSVGSVGLGRVRRRGPDRHDRVVGDRPARRSGAGGLPVRSARRGHLWVVLPVIVTPVASWFTRITGTPEPTESVRKHDVVGDRQPVGLSDGDAEHLGADDRVVVDRDMLYRSSRSRCPRRCRG